MAQADDNERLNRLNLFEGVVIGIYGNWLISFIERIGFDKTIWILGLWYQPLCVFLAFSTLLLLFFVSIFEPAQMTPRFTFMLGLGHIIGIYGALWIEGITFSTNLFYYLGLIHFFIIFGIEIRRAMIRAR